jgi:hypothetical protein
VTRLRSAVLVVVLTVAAALAARVDPDLVALPVLVSQLVVAAAPSPLDARGRVVRAPRLAPVLLTSVVATLLVLRPRLLEGAEGLRVDVSAGQSGTLTGILPAVAVGVLATFVAQLVRRDERRQLITAVAYAVGLCVVAATTAGWVAAAQGPRGPQVLAVVAAAAGAAVVVRALPVGRVAALAVAGAAGVLAAALVAELQGAYAFGWLAGGLVGLLATVVALLGLSVGRAWVAGRARTWGLPAAVAVALLGPVAYVGAQVAGLSL